MTGLLTSFVSGQSDNFRFGFTTLLKTANTLKQLFHERALDMRW